MIQTKTDIHSYKILSARTEDVTHTGLRYDLDVVRPKNAETDEEAEVDAYIIEMHDGDIDTSEAVMIFYPYWSRAGVGWGGDANWFDASSPEQAAQRWVDGSWEDYE